MLRTNMSSLEFRLRKIDERKNLLEEIKHNDLMSEKYKKTCKYLNYIEHLLKSYWLCFSLCNCFISLCSCWYYKFCSRSKNIFNRCGN